MRIVFSSVVLLILLTIAVGLGGPALEIDRSGADFAWRHYSDARFEVAFELAWLGMPQILIPATFVIALIVFGITRSWRKAALPVAAVGLAGAVATVMKMALPLSRAELGFDAPSATHAFPSGHTAATVALTSAVALALTAGKLRLIALAVAAMLSGIMMVSLIFGEVHWVTDVVGGTIVGVGAVALANAVLLRPRVVVPEG